MGWILFAVAAALLVVVVVVFGRRIAVLNRRLRSAAAADGARARGTGPATQPAPVGEEATGAGEEPAGAAGESAGEEPAEAPPPIGDTAVAEETSGAGAEAPGSADESDGPAVVDEAPPPGPGGEDQDRRLPSLWALTVLEQERQWHIGVGSGAPFPGSGRPEELDGALAVEIERIREEVGTPGSLEASVASLSPGDTALAFHATRQLLGLLVPHTQAYDLTASRADGDVLLNLVCSGWEGDAELADGVGRLLEAVAPAGGDLELDTLPDDRLRATLRLPVREGAS